jgi:hypothetical protein
MLFDFYINIIAGLVGAGLLYVIQNLYVFFVEKRSPLSGTWYVTYESADINDEFLVRQRGETLSGQIVRRLPSDEIHRRWKFEGRFKEQIFFASFWPNNEHTIGYGCWFLSRVSEDLFQGYMFLPQPLNSKSSDAIKPVKIELKRYRFS